MRIRVLIGLLLLAVSLPASAVVCTVTEARALPSDPTGKVLELINASATTQAVDFTVNEEATNPLSDTTTHIRISCTARAHFEIGTNPTATATNIMIPAAGTEYFFVPPGTSREIAFYDGTS